MSLEDAKSDVDGAFMRTGDRGFSYENTFGGATSFLRRRYSKDLTGVDVAVTGIPFDQAVTNRPGARFGPRAIREMSALQTPDPPFGWEVNPMTDLSVVDYGDMAFDYANPGEVPALIEAHVGGVLASGAAALTLGGDHSITLPLLRAHAAQHGALALVQFDAHTDSWPDSDPSRVDHGTIIYRAVQEGLIDVSRSVQIGIRTVCEDTLGIRVISAREAGEMGPAAVAAEIHKAATGPAYVTFDIDGLDPAFAPGTGTPVWGGLTSREAAAILQEMAGLRVVGGDVVEVSPPYDTAGITAVAGAHAAMEILCLLAAAKG